MYAAVIFRDVNNEDNLSPASTQSIGSLHLRTVENETDAYSDEPSPNIISVQHTFVKQTQQEAALAAENKRLALNAAYPSRSYRIWVGLLSHEVQRPEPRPLQLVELT